MSKAVRTLNLGLACTGLLAVVLLGTGIIDGNQARKSAIKSLQKLRNFAYQLGSIGANTISPALAAPVDEPASKPSMWNCAGTFTNEPNSLACDELPVSEIRDNRGYKYITKEWNR